MSELATLELRFNANADNVKSTIEEIVQLVKSLQSEINTALGEVNTAESMTDLVNEMKTSMEDIKQSIDDMAKKSTDGTKELEDNMKKASKTTKDESKKTVSAIDKIKNAFKTLGKFFAITTSISLIKKLTSAMINLASETLVSTRLLNATFGDLADTVSLFGEGLNRAWGISATAVNQNVASVYQLAKNLGIANTSALNMSKGITQLSYELANLYGKDQSQAFTALKNALNGQYRTLKKEYNIVIDEARLKSIALENGIISEGQSLNSTTKAMATYLAIVQQSQGAVGSMSSGTRNIAQQINILKAQLSDTGKYWSMAFAPILTYVIPAISALINILGRLGQYFAAVMSKLFGFGSSWKDTANALAGGGSIGAGISSSMEDAEDSIGATTGALKKMNKQLAGIDELNVLKQPEDSGGSGSGVASGGYGGAFEIPEMAMPEGDSEVKKWADNIIKFLSPVISLLKSLAIGIKETFDILVIALKSVWDNGGKKLYESLGNLCNKLLEWATILNEQVIKPVIMPIIETVLPIIGEAIGMIAGVLADIIDWLVKLVGPLFETDEGLEILRDILIGLIALKVRAWFLGIVGSIATFVASIAGTAAGVAVGATAILSAIAVVADWFKEHWDDSKSFSENIVIGFVDGIKALWGWLVETWNNLWNGIVEWFKDLFGIHSPSTLFADFGKFLLEGFINGIQSMWDAVKDLFNKLWNWIIDGVKSFIQSVIDKVKTFVKNIVDKVAEMKNSIVSKFTEMKTKIATIINNVKTTLGNIVTWVKNTFVGGFRTALNNIRSFFSSTFNALVNIVKVPFNAVIDLVNRAIDGLNSIHVDIPWWVPGFGGKSYGISIPKLPKLYTGGLAYGETPALVGDYAGVRANPEVIAPLDKLSTMVIGAMRTALLDANQVTQNDGATYVIQVDLDGKIISQKVIKDIRQFEANTGKPVLGY